MITKLKYVRNYGVFQNYSWPLDLQPFTKKNVIYGWNYTGKTSISRLFEMLGGAETRNRFPDIEFEVEYEESGSKTFSHKSNGGFPFDVVVFNQDYIQKNLMWGKPLPFEGIAFDVGENIQIRRKVDKYNKLEVWAKKRIQANNVAIGRYNDLEVLFKKEARKIKNDIFNSLIEFDLRHFKIVKTSIDGNIEANIVSNDSELQKTKAEALAVNNKALISPINFTPIVKDLFLEVSALISNTPPQSQIIDILESKSELYQWAKQGFDLHNQLLEECAFCGNTIKSERILNLTNYFSNAASRLRVKIEEVRDRIANEEERIDSVTVNGSKNDFIDGLHDRYEFLVTTFKKNVESYKKCLIDLIVLLDKKEDGNIFIAMTAKAYDESILNNLQLSINSLDSLIEEHNNFIKNFDATQNQARECIKKHFVALVLRDNKVREIENQKNIAEKRNSFYEVMIVKLNARREVLLAQIKSIVAGKEEMNRYLKLFFNRSDIFIEVTKDDKFQLKRGEYVADNLSEGEKTAISFSYFLVFLEGLIKDSKAIKTVVFIDDPISSLDSNHIAQVYSTINSFFFRKGLNPKDPKEVVPCFKQLLISTHNFDFFNFLKDSYNLNKTKKSDPSFSCSYFYVQRVSNRESKIIKLPHVLRKRSEYILLFEILHSFFESGCDSNSENAILIPNALRRFFEIYTLIKLPGTDGEIEQRISILMGGTHQLKVLHHFSHATNIEMLSKQDELLSIIPQAVGELFELLKKDELHFASLKEAIGT